MKKIILTSVALATVAVTTAIILNKKNNKKKVDNINETAEVSTETEATETVENEYEIVIEYCPRLEDGESCKTVHDSPLEMFETKNISVPDWYQGLSSWETDIGGKMYDLIHCELEGMGSSIFTLDYMGFEFSTPIIMGHYGDDPSRSIIVRIRRY